MSVISMEGAIALMDEQQEVLRQLVAEACQHQAGSNERQRRLIRIVRLITHKLWKENTPYYQDALQQTWIYFCQNICEGNTGDPYDPTRGSVITWLNNYLRRRLQDCYRDAQKQQARTIPFYSKRARTGEILEMSNSVESLEAPPDVPPILDVVRTWVETDPDRELRRIYLDQCPQVTAQVLILRRLPPETSWKDLAAEFNVPVSTLSTFYQRKCMPRLRNFGKSEGYI